MKNIVHTVDEKKEIASKIACDSALGKLLLNNCTTYQDTITSVQPNSGKNDNEVYGVLKDK